NARTPQQNGVAERRNMTLIEAARTMLADAKLPVTFWAKAVNTACYVQNKVLVIKPHNKTPYELFNEISPVIGFLRSFRCHIMILNTLDHLGKFDAKGDEGYFVGYSLSSKAFKQYKVFNSGKLLSSVDISSGNTYTNTASKDDTIPVNNAPQQEQQEVNRDKEVPESSGNLNLTASTKVSTNDSFELASSSIVETVVPTISTPVLTDSLSAPLVTSSIPKIISKGGSSFPEPQSLGNAMSFENRLEDFFRDTSNAVRLNEVEANLSNMETPIQVNPTPTLRIHKDHPKSQIIGPVDTPVQTRQKTKNVDEQSFIATINQKTNLDLLQYCLFSCFLSPEEPKKIVLVDCPSGVRPIGTKWVLKNKKDKRGIVIRNKACLVAQGHTQQKGIDYKEVFAPVARIEAIRLFLTYASYMGFTVYQMDVKSAFLYGTINEEVYVMQPLGFQDLEFPHRVYKVKKAIYGLHQAPRAWYGTLSKNNPWGKDGTGKDVELHLYRSMIRSLMYLTASRPNIMFAVCACARHQVTLKECHLHAVKRIIWYLKGNPKLGLWYPKESPFDLVAYLDSDYDGANQDRKSTTEGCQFLGRRLISWQCKKQTIVATSITKAEYVAAASGYDNVADLLTKACDVGRFQYLVLAKATLTYRGKGLESRLGNHSVEDQGEDLLDKDKSADKGSDSTDEMSHVLGTLGAANILASEGLRLVFTTASLSVTTASTCVSSVVATANGSFSLFKKDKRKGKMTKPEQPSKEKVLEQMSVQLARDLEAKFAQEDQIIREQAERDFKIARIYAEKELDMMIVEFDRSNEMVVKYLSEYEQAEDGLSHDEKVELINELVINAGWKTKDFKGMTFEQIEEKFILVWEKMQDFVPMNSKLESKRLKRPSEEPKELFEEELKKMIELVPVEELYIEALQSLVKETCSTTEVTDEKAMELWVELKRLYERDSKDPLWALQ
nr:hypothetical protein [Tanacetum cinerariifolium]